MIYDLSNIDDESHTELSWDKEGKRHSRHFTFRRLWNINMGRLSNYEVCIKLYARL